MKIVCRKKAQRLITAAACLGMVALSSIPGAMAQFNPEALKSMQKEGHKILQEAQEAQEVQEVQEPQVRRPYKLQGNLCLDTREDGLLVTACDGGASQAWTLDDKRRLMAHNGLCVGGATLEPCSTFKRQLWSQDAQNRLVSDAGFCLQGRGNPPKAGAKVVAVTCSKAVGQIWN